MKYLWTLVVLLVIGCETSKEQVDLLVLNANVYTVDEGFSKAEAFAVQNGRFVAVGTSEAIKKSYASDQIFDAKGLAITPGLID
ncbi:MAG: amidohydrolase, partial [Flavobacteriales bacterium]